ncbi:MAG: hypothetical protein M3340_00435 [Actinomycetota bacterium]|nr:hypothetical protein [Actinomycetota bacterium]
MRRWVEHGALYRIVRLSDDHAVVELCTCHGEPVDRIDSDDPRLVEYLRLQSSGAAGPA